VFGAAGNLEAKADEAQNIGCRFRRPFFGSFFGRSKKERKELLEGQKNRLEEARGSPSAPAV
jgi:hypothetical protein